MEYNLNEWHFVNRKAHHIRLVLYNNNDKTQVVGFVIVVRHYVNIKFIQQIYSNIL